MSYWKRYLKPKNVDEALSWLRDAHGEARLIAGGTDLLLDLQQGRVPPVDTLIDVTEIPELCELREEGESLFIGAAVTHARILVDPLTRHHAPCLVQACALIGGPQVRNVATLGGNVAHGLPAADGTIALLALGAEALVVDSQGRRELPLADLFAAPGRLTLPARDALLIGFRIPIRWEREGSAFHRVMRPQGVAIAILNMALWLRLDERERIDDARLALGPSGPTPRRFERAEAALRGQPASRVAFESILDTLSEDASLRSSAHRASADYRRHLLGVLLHHVLPQAVASAKGNLLESAFEEDAL